MLETIHLNVPEKSVKQWLAEMKAAGFYGKYEARSGDLVIKGEIPRNIELENRVVADALAARKLEAEKEAKQRQSVASKRAVHYGRKNRR
jgi:DnaJ-class molecular chaperone